MTRMTKVLFLAVLIISAATCGDSPSGPGGNASLTLKLTDSPYSDARAVLVTFSTVSAHRTGGDFSVIPFSGGATTRTCDLKKLVGAEDILGTVALPAGEYTQIRLMVTSASLYFDSPTIGPACAPAVPVPAGASAALTIPSGEVKLNRPFSLAAETSTTILLDFRGDDSIHSNGSGYTMTPVIGIVSVQ